MNMVEEGQRLKEIWRKEFDLAARTDGADRRLMWARIAARFVGAPESELGEIAGSAWLDREIQRREGHQKSVMASIRRGGNGRFTS